MIIIAQQEGRGGGAQNNHHHLSLLLGERRLNAKDRERKREIKWFCGRIGKGVKRNERSNVISLVNIMMMIMMFGTGMEQRKSGSKEGSKEQNLLNLRIRKSFL